MSITDLRPLFSISYIGLKHGKEPMEFEHMGKQGSMIHGVIS